MTGPYRDMPSHGIAYDTWAGIVATASGRRRLRLHPRARVDRHPRRAAVRRARLARRRSLRARETGEGCQLEIAQSDAAAAMDWLRSETWKAYERPQSEVTGNKADNYERRAPGTAGMEEGVRYQLYASKDGHVLFMASEQEFWKNFCDGVDRMRSVRAVAGREVRRPRARQPRAPRDPARHLRDPHVGRVARVRPRAQHADRAGQHAEDDRSTIRSSRTASRGSPRHASAPTCCRRR